MIIQNINYHQISITQGNKNANFILVYCLYIILIYVSLSAGDASFSIKISVLENEFSLNKPNFNPANK